MRKISLNNKSIINYIFFGCLVACLQIRASEESPATTTAQTTTTIIPKETKADLREKIRKLENTLASRDRMVGWLDELRTQNATEITTLSRAAIDNKHKISRLEAENSKLRDQRDETPVEKLFNFMAKKTKRDSDS